MVPRLLVQGTALVINYGLLRVPYDSKAFLKVLLGSLIFCWCRVPWGSLGFFGVPKGFEGYLKVAINSLKFHRVL